MACQLNYLAFACALILLTNLVSSYTLVKDGKYKLNSGNLIPIVGLGTSGFKGDELKTALDNALEVGYRHIDTAEFYENEEDIGKALKELLPKHNLTRHDIFITSKINISDVNPDGYRSVKRSLEKLGTDYIDLYLIHHPAIVFFDEPKQFTKGPRNAEIRSKKWQELVKAQKEGLVKDIGISNYGVKHLKELLSNNYGVKPAVNQIKWNPVTQPRDILEFCQKEGLQVIAYSSLRTRVDIDLKNNDTIKKIADKLGKSTTQILLRWPVQEGIAIIPKSRSKKHLAENLELNFVIPEDDMKILKEFKQMPSWFNFNDID